MLNLGIPRRRAPTGKLALDVLEGRRRGTTSEGANVYTSQ